MISASNGQKQESAIALALPLLASASAPLVSGAAKCAFYALWRQSGNFSRRK